jgi:predicted HNH restriction endonuclease
MEINQYFAVITENDISQWQDDTGVLYHFPKRYAAILKPGTKIIYYKGKLKDKNYFLKRRSPDPHYFGIATISNIFPDKESQKEDLFATIENYRGFEIPVLAKDENGYFEIIPSNRASNYWRDGVRQIDQTTYNKIVSKASFIAITEINWPYQATLSNNDLDNSLESYTEGEKKLKYVTTYERNPRLRRQAIAIRGTTCHGCGFNFGKFYGQYGEGLIHIHHIIPVSELVEPKTVNPATDLVPVCANCHALIHRKKDYTLTIQQLREIIKNSSNPTFTRDA